MNKRKKHLLQYTGPGEITEVLSPNNSSFRIHYKGRDYDRNVMHMNMYRSPEEVDAAIQMVHDTTVYVGSYVAVLDSTDAEHYHIAHVIDINDKLTKLHYLGTRSQYLRNAVWSKLYHHPGTNLVVDRQPENIARDWSRFTGTVPTMFPDDSLIILANVGMTDRMRVDKYARNKLGRLEQTHHIFMTTFKKRRR